jgi:serine/threonine protein kinase
VFSGENFAHLVDFLATLHGLKFAHRDIRPDNLVSYEGLLLPIDFGSLCALNKALPYHGTTHYASKAVSDQLTGKPNKGVTNTASDDLVTLVCSARQLANLDDNFASELLLHADNSAEFWSQALTGGIS